MADNISSNRWCEGYLVRYFVPALFGFFAVRWILYQYPGVVSVTFLNNGNSVSPIDVIDSAFLVAAGFLYCYIASYPILVFHATRVLDFERYGEESTKLYLNPYLSSIVLCIIVYLISICYCFDHNRWTICYYLLLLCLVAYAFVQCYRVYLCYKTKNPYNISVAYAYTSKLSNERTAFVRSDTQDKSSDVSETYRHLREHGNTAFIVLLETTLCPVVYVALGSGESLSPIQWLVPIVLIWIVPSVFIHWFAQHLERRFSKYS